MAPEHTNDRLTPRELQGKRLFLVLAALLVVLKLYAAWRTFRLNADLYYSLYALFPLGLSVAVPFLWKGNVWLVRIVGGACIMSGTKTLLALGTRLLDFDVPGELESIEILPGILGVVDVLAGLAFLFHPSLSAFFQHQRVPASDTLRAQPTLRSATKNGSIVAAAFVVVLVVVSAIMGGLFGFHPAATIFGHAPPGWGGVPTTVAFNLVFLGLPAAGVGFIIGFVASYW